MIMKSNKLLNTTGYIIINYWIYNDKILHIFFI